MKNVAAFMYGNDVRLSDAVACYNACIGRHQSSVETALRAWCFVWDRDVNQSHKEQYYRMSLKCQAWINGKAREQYEAVKPVVTVRNIRPLETRHFEKTRRSTWLHAMDPLAVVEEKMVSVDSWPSNVLTDKFYKKPKVRFSNRVASFLYGNGVSVRDFAKFTRRPSQLG